MTRSATAAWLTEASRVYGARPVTLYEADFGPAGIFRTWTGVGPLLWGGNTYSGSGELLDVQPLAEATDRSTTGVEVKLAINDAAGATDILQEAMGASIHGRIAKIAVGWLNDAGALVVDPIYYRWDELSSLVIDETAEGVIQITVQTEEQLEDLDRSQRYRTTLSSQIDIDFTDKGLQFLTTIDQLKILWGDLFYKEIKGN